MDSPELLEADELDADLVPCRIELLCAMAEKDMPPQWPDVQLLAQWKQIFLQAWDASIDELEPSEEYKRERRATLVATFDRMLALAHLAEEEGDTEE